MMRPPVKPPSLGRPSKNLGNVFNSQTHQVDLFSKILPSRTVPFNIIKQARVSAASALSSRTEHRARYLIPQFQGHITNLIGRVRNGSR